MDSNNNIRITSLKRSDFDSFQDFYISIMLEREDEESKILYKQNRIGLKGQLFLDAGIIFAPYIPLETVQIVIPTGVGKSDVRSRYTTKIVNSNLYGTFGQELTGLADKNCAELLENKLSWSINE